MNIREYQPADQKSCVEIFKSNCPEYFDPKELEQFVFWLNQQGKREPAYKNSKADCYYVIEKDSGIVGCGGFYLVKDENCAQLAWGMIHSKHHKKGFGRALYEFRELKIKEIDQALKITLGTSQHSFGFFQKMGLKVTNMIGQGYGENIDRYDMQKS